MANKEYAVTITAREQALLLPVELEARPLGARELAGHTLVTLISAGTELAGSYLGATFPRSPGYAAVFRVEEVGGEVADVQAGDLVFGMGRHQSYQRLLREQVAPLPAGLAPEAAVFARMMGVTMSTLTTTAARPPEKVLISGLGLVGHLAAQIFALSGYEVLACEPNEARRALAAQSGIQRVFARAPLDDAEYAGKVALVVECSGHEQATLDGCRIARKRGEVVLVGVPWTRQSEIFAHDLLHAIFHRYVVVRSGWEWELPLQPSDFRVNSIYGNFAAALGWLAAGRVRVEGLYQKRPPREAQQAYQDLLHKRAEKLAILFDWTDCP